MILFSFVNCYSSKILRIKLKQFKYSEPEKTTGPSGVNTDSGSKRVQCKDITTMHLAFIIRNLFYNIILTIKNFS